MRSDHPALAGRTVFPISIKSPDVTRCLKPASGNSKLGKGSNVITKGRWKGMRMYSLTLEERATCPRSCQQWRNCYGNNMPFAHRLSHEGPELTRALTGELSHLARSGNFVVRLHVLGDFFNVPYAEFWGGKLDELSQLHIYGYTHRDPEDSIGEVISRMNRSDRCWIRWSDRGGPMSANVESEEGILCPEQLGKTQSCLTCGLCWQTTRAIAFAKH